MMTPERARWLLNNMRAWGSGFRYAFRRDYSPSEPIDADGITEEEDKEIKRLWDRMPGYTCYYDAVQRIARGEG